MIENTIYIESNLETMKRMPDGCIDCCVTSPPYFGLRDYGHEGQIGLEETPELFVAKLLEVFSEVRRVLKKDGTLWLNLGDSYNGSGKKDLQVNSPKQMTSKGASSQKGTKILGLKNKDLIGIPWMVAFALRSSGWYLRQDIIWSKPNPMPESVTDRCTKAHEYIFLLSKSAKYYYDQGAIKQLMADASFSRLSQDIEQQEGSDRVPGKTNGAMKAAYNSKYSFKRENSKRGVSVMPGKDATHRPDRKDPEINLYANKRSVWTVTTKPFKEAHFATFPEDLIVDCIKAGCPEGGIVYDPFMGAGTTALVALRLNRKFIGSEISAEYTKIAEKRLEPYLKQHSLFKSA